jgi:hypothetical protein
MINVTFNIDGKGVAVEEIRANLRWLFNEVLDMGFIDGSLVVSDATELRVERTKSGSVLVYVDGDTSIKVRDFSDGKGAEVFWPSLGYVDIARARIFALALLKAADLAAQSAGEKG